MNDIRQTIDYANYLSKIGWQVERFAGINYFIKPLALRAPLIKKLFLVGSIIKIQRPEEIRIQKIRELARKYRALQIIIEPKTQLDARFLSSVGFKSSKNPFLPTKTLQIDLTRSKRKIFRKLKKETRLAIRKTNKLETCEKEIEKEIKDFRNAWKKAVGLKRYVPSLDHLIRLKKSFKKKSFFLTTKEMSSGAIFLLADSVAYYWQSFTSKGGRQNLAQYKIVWEGLLWAKKMGARVFDFEGIYDERFPNKSWLGFTHFKKSFCGYEVEYPGTFIKNLLPFRKL